MIQFNDVSRKGKMNYGAFLWDMNTRHASDPGISHLARRTGMSACGKEKMLPGAVLKRLASNSFKPKGSELEIGLICAAVPKRPVCAKDNTFSLSLADIWAWS